MSSYAHVLQPATLATRSTTRVNSFLAWLLPNFAIVVFAVTLLQVLFLSQGARSLFRDSDTGWHVRNGEAIIDSLTLPRTDPFSYTRAGRTWFAWEWFSDVLLGQAHRTGGLAGVALLSALAIALTAWGAARLSLALGGNLFLTAGAMVVLLGTTSLHWLARPHVFSWLFGLVFVAVAERERMQPTRWLYALPVVSCLWANMHGSFLLGPAILFAYALLIVFELDQHHPVCAAKGASRHFLNGAAIPPQLRRGITTAGLSLLATFLNPYGWHLHEHVFAYLQNTYLMDHISEFRSYSFHAPGAYYVEALIVVTIIGIVALFRQRAYSAAILGIALLHISFYSARHLPTTAVIMLPLCVAALTKEARHVPRLRAWLDYSDRLREIDRRIVGFIPLAAVLIAALAGMNFLARNGAVGFNSQAFPVRAAQFLADKHSTARIFTKDQWGGYLIYRFGGQTKVFLDGRSDFYGPQMLETYSEVMDVKPAWSSVLKQYDVGFVLIPSDHALASALTLSPEWKRIYSDSVGTIFERVG